MLDDDLLELKLEETDHPIWLAWVVPGVGESEILIVTFGDDNADGFPGGDRSGIDRGENNPPPDDGKAGQSGQPGDGMPGQ